MPRWFITIIVSYAKNALQHVQLQLSMVCFSGALSYHDIYTLTIPTILHQDMVTIHSTDIGSYQGIIHAIYLPARYMNAMVNAVIIMIM